MKKMIRFFVGIAPNPIQEISQVGAQRRSAYCKFQKKKQTLNTTLDGFHGPGIVSLGHLWSGTAHPMLRRSNQLLLTAEHDHFTRPHEHDHSFRTAGVPYVILRTVSLITMSWYYNKPLRKSMEILLLFSKKSHFASKVIVLGGQEELVGPRQHRMFRTRP